MKRAAPDPGEEEPALKRGRGVEEEESLFIQLTIEDTRGCIFSHLNLTSLTAVFLTCKKLQREARRPLRLKLQPHLNLEARLFLPRLVDDALNHGDTPLAALLCPTREAEAWTRSALRRRDIVALQCERLLAPMESIWEELSPFYDDPVGVLQLLIRLRPTWMMPTNDGRAIVASDAVGCLRVLAHWRPFFFDRVDLVREAIRTGALRCLKLMVEELGYPLMQKYPFEIAVDVAERELGLETLCYLEETVGPNVLASSIYKLVGKAVDIERGVILARSTLVFDRGHLMTLALARMKPVAYIQRLHRDGGIPITNAHRKRAETCYGRHPDGEAVRPYLTHDCAAGEC